MAEETLLESEDLVASMELWARSATLSGTSERLARVIAELQHPDAGVSRQQQLLRLTDLFVRFAQFRAPIRLSLGALGEIVLAQCGAAAEPAGGGATLALKLAMRLVQGFPDALAEAEEEAETVRRLVAVSAERLRRAASADEGVASLGPFVQLLCAVGLQEPLAPVLHAHGDLLQCAATLLPRSEAAGPEACWTWMSLVQLCLLRTVPPPPADRSGAAEPAAAAAAAAMEALSVATTLPGGGAQAGSAELDERLRAACPCCIRWLQTPGLQKEAFELLCLLCATPVWCSAPSAPSCHAATAADAVPALVAALAAEGLTTAHSRDNAHAFVEALARTAVPQGRLPADLLRSIYDALDGVAGGLRSAFAAVPAGERVDAKQGFEDLAAANTEALSAVITALGPAFVGLVDRFMANTLPKFANPSLLGAVVSSLGGGDASCAAALSGASPVVIGMLERNIQSFRRLSSSKCIGVVEAAGVVAAVMPEALLAEHNFAGRILPPLRTILHSGDVDLATASMAAASSIAIADRQVRWRSRRAAALALCAARPALTLPPLPAMNSRPTGIFG
jgi:hypothetical protein